jgi:hypothetical protein
MFSPYFDFLEWIRPWRVISTLAQSCTATASLSDHTSGLVFTAARAALWAANICSAIEPSAAAAVAETPPVTTLRRIPT